MKFRLSSSSNWYDNKHKERLEKLGFKFEKDDNPICSSEMWYKIDAEHDDPGYATPTPTIEFETLEELVAFQKEWGDLILLPDCCIEIYDAYTE